eukprot:TRINITY_DN2510_c0_g1_i6.p1 TRINITY_DN2510_c0_g1~~TRINITY_DN2510_c0_g1_i6.p1  ORF type:complete len:505 (-),score=110.33 TRINITY_DN2510_c0_g1_i6:235-1749(-)
MVQKGMQFMELEVNAKKDGYKYKDFSGFQMISSTDLLTRDVDDIVDELMGRKEDDSSSDDGKQESEGQGQQQYQQEKQQQQQQQHVQQQQQQQSQSPSTQAQKRGRRESQSKQKVKAESTPEKAVKVDEVEDVKMTDVGDVSMGSQSGWSLGQGQQYTLTGHESEVFVCQWNPIEDILASGSGDMTARIWDVRYIPEKPITCTIMQRPSPNEKSRDVTTVDWHQDGVLLATGAYDGLARIWDKSGQLKRQLEGHQGPIFAVKWSKDGRLLLTGSVDKCAIVWQVDEEKEQQRFQVHEGATLDVDWASNERFATCSTDRSICICELGMQQPLKTFSGHKDEVNAIKWDPTGQILASCSDDTTAKIWKLSSDRCLHTLCEHQQEIYTIRWAPSGVAFDDMASPSSILATASFDSRLKLWDVERGKCIYTFCHHLKPVYSMGFHPSGKYMASGSFDKQILVWDIQANKVVRQFKVDGGIFEVAWNGAGTKIAACTANKTVEIIDLRK